MEENKKKLLTTKYFIKIFRENGPDFKFEINTEKFEVEEGAIKLARNVVTAERFIKDYVEKNGTRSFLSERLRDGFIGEEVKVNGGILIRTVRGKPYGSVVSIPVDGNEIVTGISYISKEDESRNFPILGQYLALRRAIEGKEGGWVRAEKSSMQPKSRSQILHFEKRALAYFYPDLYSFSRGSKPINTYDPALQKRRLMVMGEEKYNESVCIKRTPEQFEKIREGRSDFKPGEE